jgi:hypothetical protein
VANVLLVAAFQLGDPVAVFVGAEGGDFSFGHRAALQCCSGLLLLGEAIDLLSRLSARGTT